MTWRALLAILALAACTPVHAPAPVIAAPAQAPEPDDSMPVAASPHPASPSPSPSPVRIPPAAPPADNPVPPPAPERLGARAAGALWITRWDYKSEADVRGAIANAKALGCDTVLFQVRGAADAFYRGAREPWARELRGRDPGFDPLAIACEAAHAAGLALHAYLNVMPVWKGKTAPTDPAHLWHAHPDWLARAKDGQPPALNEHYVVLNPAHPEARAHLAAVFADVAGRYPIDGIHLDYVRYLGPEHSYDAVSLAAFREATGHRPDADPDGWTAWRRSQITACVRAIADACRAARPGLVISAAVWRTPESGREKVLQDWVPWVRDGLVDIAYPMIYTTDPETFRRDLAACVAEAPPGKVCPGIGAYLADEKPKVTPAEAAQSVSAQIAAAREAGCAGVGLFAHGSFFATADTDGGYGGKDAARLTALRTARREAVQALLVGPR